MLVPSKAHFNEVPRYEGKELNKQQNICLNQAELFWIPKPGVCLTRLAAFGNTYSYTNFWGKWWLGRQKERLLDLWLVLVAGCHPKNPIVLWCWILRRFLDVHGVHEALWRKAVCGQGRGGSGSGHLLFFHLTMPRAPGVSAGKWGCQSYFSSGIFSWSVL